MRSVTAKTFLGLREMGRTAIIGTTPHLVNNGLCVAVRVVPECGEKLKVEAYGGGVRWHCPRCDCRAGWSGLPTITHTNGPVPGDGRCHRPG